MILRKPAGTKHGQGIYMLLTHQQPQAQALMAVLRAAAILSSHASPLGRGSRKEHEGHIHCVSHWPDAHRHPSSQHEGKALQQVALSLGGI